VSPTCCAGRWPGSDARAQDRVGEPLKGSPRYEPLARGMAAALPSIDEFLPGHNLESLEALSRVLGD